jgi:elongation factor 1-alpha
MVHSDGNFTASLAKGTHKAGEVQGQTRPHARLINLLGCKQLIVGVNKMDCDVAKYGKERYDEVATEVRDVLVKVGWKKKFVADRVPVIPISGWMGDNLIKASDKMGWWKGVDVKVGKKKVVHVHTLYDALDKMVSPAARNLDSDLRMPVSGVYKIKGVGDVITGRIEQGKCEPNTEVIFLPTHTAANACAGKVFTVEMHHKAVPMAGPGDNVGMNVKGLDKLNMPQVGDVMIKKGDEGIKRCGTFTAQVQILDHPGELKVGYTPIAYVRTGRAPVRLTEIKWKIGKSTGGQKVEDPLFIKRNEVAEVVFTPTQPFVVDAFKSCEGLGRVAIMEGNGVVMLGKVAAVSWFVPPTKK